MKDYWKFFAGEAHRIGSSLYEILALKVRDDEDLKLLAAQSRAGQPHANMLFGAVHFLLLRGADHLLREYYPTLGGGRLPEDENLFPLFRDFVVRHREEISALVSARVTNTNEVGRSSALHAGFRVLAEQIEMPVHLIELGPSAGLNLVWDRYGVRYRRGAEVAAVVSPDADLVIECELKGDATPPTGAPPKIASRLGIELNPVNLADRNDRDWLRALIWPDQPQRLERLDRAITLFMRERPEIRAGDVLEMLPSVLAALPPEPVCLYHTIVLYQFSTEMTERLDGMLMDARRPLYRLGLEYDGAAYSLILSRYGDGKRKDRLLGRAHPHGTWLEWLT